MTTGRVPEQTCSSEPCWGAPAAAGSRDGDNRRARRLSTCELDLPPVLVLLRRALQLPIQRQVCPSAVLALNGGFKLLNYAERSQLIISSVPSITLALCVSFGDIKAHEAFASPFDPGRTSRYCADCR